MLNHTIELFWFLPWQPIKVEKIGVFPGPIYLIALPFGNGLQYRNSDFKRFNRMNFSTLCTILVASGPETSEFTTLTIAPFAAIRQKSAYHAKYIRISWTYLDLLYRFGRRIGGDDYSNIRLVVTQGTLLTCYDNQLNSWDVVRNDHYSLLRRSTTDWPIVNLLWKISMALIRPHHVLIWWTSVQ